MEKQIKIPTNVLLDSLFQYATVINTEEGNTYHTFDCWFRGTEDGWELFFNNLPEDLQEFITKVRLGGDNAQPIKPEL